MINSYKIVVSNKNIYEEAQLPVDEDAYVIGTTLECNLRLHKELFFEQFQLNLFKQDDQWQITCSENIYLSASDERKLITTELKHGDELTVKYQNSDMELFLLSFVIGFEYKQQNYERIINLSEKQTVTIGGMSTCNIALSGEYIKDDLIELTRQDDSYMLVEKYTQYGVYVNGTRIKGNATLKDMDFFSLANFSFFYKNNQLHTCKSSDMKINAIEYKDTSMQKSAFSYPEFNRNTRVINVIDTQSIEILDPPNIPEKPKNNIVLALLPAVGMLALTVLLQGSMGTGGYALLTVCTMGLGIVTTVLGFVSNKKEYWQQTRNRKKKYYQYIDNKKKEIMSAREQERKLLNEIYYDMDEDIELVKDFSGRLFERRPEEEDFLTVRVGTGDCTAHRKIEYKRQEQLESEDELADIPGTIADTYKNVEDAPVVVHMMNAGAVGVIGKGEQLYAAMKNMILDICIRHHYNDVKLFLVVSPEQTRLVQWTRFLPHLKNDDLSIRNIVCDDESKTCIFEYLYKELSRRESEKQTYPHMVVFLYDEMGIKRHPLIKYVEKADSLGITFVFFEKHQELLAPCCSEIVQLNSLEDGKVIHAQNQNDMITFQYNPVEDAIAGSVVMKMAPVYCDEVSLEGGLTRNISLYELLHIFSTEDLDLKQNWSVSKVYDTLAAPIGVRAKGDVVYLDLHERNHGPHGLVAGTTGSGKSEILQTYILSMATLFHPYDVSFVIIDFKGGGMANQFKSLPHMVGTITNIDGKEIARSLLSIKAELTKRQNLFAEADVNHIDKYIKKYKSKKVSQPLPHLIIIVDEFAELKAEQPEFMKELISAARIGRSLGVHLILATQKPAGQVDEQIWSNSKFKLCLKVQTKEDSNEVIKSPLAAEITEPGRAYFQVGNNEIFELFQSAYSGCSDSVDTTGSRTKEFDINEVELTGKRNAVYSQKAKKQSGKSSTQLDAIVRHVEEYCESNNISRLSSICLPPLQECIVQNPEDEHLPQQSYKVDVGIYDDPRNQYQGAALLDTLNNNTIIIGSSQTGKTNLLQLIIKSLTRQYSTKELQIYVLDFSSMVLKNFENLHHVGGVVCASEDEKLKNLFKLLNTEMKERKEKLLAVGVSSYSAYLEAGYKDMAKIILIIDNLTALNELYMQDEDQLLPFCREGLAVGISIIVANAQTSGIGYKYLANFSNRISLYCNDPAEYGNLFDYCKMKPDDIKGRCLIELNRVIYECQSYLAFQGEREIDRVNQIRLFIEEINGRLENRDMARIIPDIPKLLTEQYLNNKYPEWMNRENLIVNGLCYSDVMPSAINLEEFNMIGLCGRHKAGKGNYIRYVMKALQNKKVGAQVYVMDDISRKYAELQKHAQVKAYSCNPNEFIDMVDQIHAILADRYEQYMQDEACNMEAYPAIMLIVQNNEALEVLENNYDALEHYKEIVTKYKKFKITILFSNVENNSISYSAPEPLRILKERNEFIIFDDINNIKVIDVPYEYSKLYRKPIERGDAYYFREQDCKKIKLALCQNN